MLSSLLLLEFVEPIRVGFLDLLIITLSTVLFRGDFRRWPACTYEVGRLPSVIALWHASRSPELPGFREWRERLLTFIVSATYLRLYLFPHCILNLCEGSLVKASSLRLIWNSRYLAVDLNMFPHLLLILIVRCQCSLNVSLIQLNWFQNWRSNLRHGSMQRVRFGRTYIIICRQLQLTIVLRTSSFFIRMHLHPVDKTHLVLERSLGLWPFP